jgi:hypothetical protein
MNYIQAINPTSLPNILYHYTTADSTYGIAKSKELWATNIHYLNDESEFKHAVDLMKSELWKLTDDSSPFARPKDEVHEFVKYLSDRLETIRELHIFVFSFSGNGNLLSQWRAYCRSGGYSLGFNSKDLRNSTVNNSFFLAKCIYDSAAQQSVLHSILTETMQGITSSGKKEREDQATAFLIKLVRVAPLLKHPAFSEECEWRLVLCKLNS